MKTEPSVVNRYNRLFCQQGWICPKCRRVYPLYIPICLYCEGDDTAITSNLCDRSNMPVNEEKLKEERKQDQL